MQPLKASDFPGNAVAKFVALAPRSAIAQLTPLATVVDLSGVSTFSFPLPTNFAAASFVAEGAPIPVRQGLYQGFAIGPLKKIALLAGLSGELENGSGGTATTIIGHTIEVAVGQGTDAVLLSASAATPDAPAGLLNGVTPITGSADMTKDLSALISEISSKGIDSASVVFICSPPQALSLSLTAGPHFTHKIIEASGLAAGTVVAIATAGLIFAGDGVPQIDTSKQTTLHMADPAAEIAPPGGPISAPTISQFQTDTIALKCTSLICWSVAPGAVAVLTGASW
ncbi:hypothetical protein AB4Z51_03310 [Bradyrhizobium sp. 2TAF36]|uniref:hypothetical protein n=1 Tax=Bradyrhizobium sp. 2TAF36 TaxID=3233016 RepID=UPI003F8EBE32